MELKFYGNREPIELIRRMVCKNREQRSILIHGEKGLGKKHLAKYIEDTLCDVDAAEGQVLARYLADCSVGGCIIYWEDMI